MNRFTNYIVKQSNKMDLTLKISYSSHIGWNIKIHEKGYDVPVIDISNTNKEIAFSEAHRKMKEYMKVVRQCLRRKSSMNIKMHG